MIPSAHSSRRGAILALSAAALLLWAAPPARADTPGQGGKVYAIEDRDVMGTHELTLSVGSLPMDAFVKGLTLQGSYTYHFTQLLAWEVLGGIYSFNIDTGLKDELRDRFDVHPTEEGELTWILNSNLVFTPLFGKLAVINERVFSGELFFELGYALGGFTAAYPSGIDFGMGLRLFVSRHFSVRLDIRDYLFFPEATNHLYLSLGVSLTFGFQEEQQRGGQP